MVQKILREVTTRILARISRAKRPAKHLYGRWQVWRGFGYTGRRIEGGPLAGYLLYAGRRIPYVQQFWEGSYEVELLESLRNLVESDAVVYDIGANIGYHTLLFAAMAKRGRVYAFEPLPEVMQTLRRNLSANGIENVSTVQKVVASDTGSIAIGRSIYYDQAAVAWAGHGNVTIQCEAVSLDDFIADGNVPPTVLKIDVEGAEREVLTGAIGVLARYKPLVVCESHGSECAQQVYELLRRLGYELFRAERGYERIGSATEVPSRMEDGHVLACHPGGVQPPRRFREKAKA